MKCLIVVSCLLALAAAKPNFYAGPYAGPYAAPYAAYAAPYAAHYGVASSVSSQYHAQDTLGQYSYGYSGGPSAKTETRTADGITRGGYSYIDGHGLVQSANYVADPVNGFRVAATNLPVGPSAPAAPVVHAAPVAVAHAAPLAYAAHGVPAVAAGVPLDTPEVAAAKAAHFQAHAEANARVFGRKKRSVGFASAAVSYAAAPAFNYGYSTYAAHAAPVAVAHAAPYAVAAPAPVAVVEPVKSFGYSTVSAHAAPVAVAHAAPYAVAAPAPVAVVEPVKSFGYSTVSAHADPVVVASHAAPVAVAHAAPAVSYAAAPAAVSYAAAPAAVSYAAAPAHFNYAPAHVSYAAPAVAVAPAVSGSSQYQAQDTLGQYSYGYADSNSQKHEARTADGITHGGYSYVDGHGLVQSASYVADAAGFRVAATNLPVGPAAP